MQIRTFTNFWSMERKLYAINDITLPTPVSLRALAVFGLSGAPWWGLLYLLHVPFANPWYLLWIAVPAALAYFGSKPIYQGKTIFQWAQSQLLYMMMESKNYKGLEVNKEANISKVVVHQDVFARKVTKQELLGQNWD